MNPVSVLKNCNTPLNLLSKPKPNNKGFVLLEKTKKLSISELPDMYKADMPANSAFFKLVKIGKTDCDSFQRKVITFFDDKNIIKRSISGSGIPTKERFYYNSTKSDDNLSNSLIKKRSITTKIFDENSKKWDIMQEEDQYLRMVHDEKEPLNDKFLPDKLQINKNIHKKSDDKKTIVSTITEYPSILKNEPATSKKMLSADITIKDDIPYIEKIKNDTNTELPANDEYLPYRFLTGEQKQISLTRHYLNENGLAPYNIDIVFAPKKVAPNSAGYFDSGAGQIVYRIPTKGSCANLCAHESEHAYQYTLIGQLGKLRTPYGNRCSAKSPVITDMEKMKEGFKYLIASEKYPSVSDTENLRENFNYWNNELEVRAREKGDLKESLYNKGMEIFHKIFPLTKGSNSF